MSRPLGSQCLSPGDKDEAFAALVAAHHGGMLAVARAILGENDAEEAVQDAWISAYKALDGFEGRGPIRNWLISIVVNEAKMRLRKQGRELTFDFLNVESGPLAQCFNRKGSWRSPPSAWECSSPEELLEEQDLLECIEKTLCTMPANHRLVLELRDLQGVESDEICNVLNVSSSNIRVMLHRARAEMFAMIERYYETGKC